MNSILNRSVNHITFSNGYTASVVRFSNGEYEIAVMYNGKLVYDTPVTADVVRCSSVHEAFEIVFSEIMMLPERNA